MTAVVVLALALAVVAVGLVAVATRELLRTVGRLRAVADGVRERLLPLAAELQAELAVTGAEVAALSDSVERAQSDRARRTRRRHGLRRR